MTATPDQPRLPCCAAASPATSVAAPSPQPAPTVGWGAFSPFIGTASKHLARVESAIEVARANHDEVAPLLKRRKRLVARCVALGASHD